MKNIFKDIIKKVDINSIFIFYIGNKINEELILKEIIGKKINK